MKFYSSGLGVMRRRRRLRGRCVRVSRGDGELAHRPQSRHVAALSLLISTPRLENELLGCGGRWRLFLLSPEVTQLCISSVAIFAKQYETEGGGETERGPRKMRLTPNTDSITAASFPSLPFPCLSQPTRTRRSPERGCVNRPRSAHILMENGDPGQGMRTKPAHSDLEREKCA